MDRRHFLRRAAVPAGMAALLAAPGLIGCSAPIPVTDKRESNLRKIAQAYQLSMDVRRRPLRDEDELKDFLGQLGPEVGPVEELLISPGDGQPYVVFFGVIPELTDRTGILAHEASGVDERRLVLTRSFEIKALSAAEFEQALSASPRRLP